MHVLFSVIGLNRCPCEAPVPMPHAYTLRSFEDQGGVVGDEVYLDEAAVVAQPDLDTLS